MLNAVFFGWFHPHINMGCALVRLFSKLSSVTITTRGVSYPLETIYVGLEVGIFLCGA